MLLLIRYMVRFFRKAAIGATKRPAQEILEKGTVAAMKEGMQTPEITLWYENWFFRVCCEGGFTTEAWFDRSTQITALRLSKGSLTTLTSSTVLRVILREIEG